MRPLYNEKHICGGLLKLQLKLYKIENNFSHFVTSGDYASMLTEVPTKTSTPGPQQPWMSIPRPRISQWMRLQQTGLLTTFHVRRRPLTPHQDLRRSS